MVVRSPATFKYSADPERDAKYNKSSRSWESSQHSAS